MTDNAGSRLPPSELIKDTERITRALREAARDALRRHKREGNPIAAWRDGQVVWIQPEDIPVQPGPDDE